MRKKTARLALYACYLIKLILRPSASADSRHEWRFIKCPITLHYIAEKNLKRR